MWAALSTDVMVAVVGGKRKACGAVSVAAHVNDDVAVVYMGRPGVGDTLGEWVL